MGNAVADRLDSGIRTFFLWMDDSGDIDSTETSDPEQPQQNYRRALLGILCYGIVCGLIGWTGALVVERYRTIGSAYEEAMHGGGFGHLSKHHVKLEHSTTGQASQGGIKSWLHFPWSSGAK